MRKGILLDYDGVMTKNNTANPFPSRRLVQTLDRPSEEIDSAFGSLWPEYLRGKLSEEELWSSLESELGLTIPANQRDIWSKWENLQPLPEMIEFVAALREDYPVGLLTNVTPTTEQEVRAGGGYNGFDFTVKSCEVGYAKPESEIYTLAMDRFRDLTPDEVIYVDDQERCLAPARALGMHAILSMSSAQVIADIRKNLNI